MLFQIIWFVLWGTLWAVYFMLDGFVLGSGMLYPFVTKTEGDKRACMNMVGPVWNGNEVWLLTAGGATFAAFPTTYALMFSYMYTALLLLLFSLIIRGISLEFRNKLDGAAWHKLWDVGYFVGSVLPSLLLGVAFGNIFMGFPMDAAGYHGSVLTLLNPYGLLVGAFFVLLFLVHGALYASLRIGGGLGNRMQKLASVIWPALFASAVMFLVATAFATRLYDNYLAMPVLLIVPLIAVGAMLSMKLLMKKMRWGGAFVASCLTIVTVVATGLVGLAPNLIPSSLDPNYSLTIFNSSSSSYTLKIMTVVALVFVPIVILYKIWAYRLFSYRVSPESAVADENY